MKRTTVVAVLVVFAVLVAGLAVGFVQFSGSSGSLDEQWVSDTARDHTGNHHPVAVVERSGGDDVIAPINDVGEDSSMTETSCALTALDGQSGDIDWQTGMPVEHCHIHTFSDPRIADVTGDDTPDVLVGTGRDALVAYDGTDGAELWDREFETIGYSPPVLTNLTDAPGEEVVAVDFRGNVYAVTADGQPLWNRSLDATVWAEPAVGDFTGDGTTEIAVGSDEGTILLSTDGTVERRFDATAQSLVDADIDGDADPELIAADVGTDEGTVTALDAASGERRWSVQTVNDPSIHALGDGDDDGAAELYVTVRGGGVLALDAETGERDWETEIAVGGDTIVAPPTLGDLGGDASPELVVPSGNGVVAVLDPANGDELASYERDVPVWAPATLGDTDGDGDREILAMYGDGRVVALDYEA
ncbi:Outer membrane protein assembly factor BamB, contains PQQ-like beta-propeller repeat [Natronoarchaeum philippinense]|uniref:Outer membrane protein assembly factor BamB, contains PQQ-like beta-propeller repeat n=1 Tax=Natronoarchaeum philippinense TaxID=558529 RepID=A0A285N2S9_NATPI|nr:PQQ-binding-like beta-propeller repeat protein [Natronoarchaeum philippinense]SNZ03774.1 Outer membrane protein assembly factor BamB, contains PQQ-like beta-propeller repeat [Natronoarchaeum philippinense]